MKSLIRILIYALLVLLALVALAGVAVLVLRQEQPVPVTSQPQPTQTQTVQALQEPDAGEQHVQQLREMLQRENLSEEARSSLQEKLEMAERLEAQQEAGKAKTTAQQSGKDPEPAASFLQIPEQPLVEGIFEGSEGLIRPSTADITNGWQGERDGAAYQVFAGSTVDDPPRGLVIVVTLDPNSPTGRREFYITPDSSARLRILEVQGQRLLLEDEQGGRSYFDLASRTFHH